MNHSWLNLSAPQCLDGYFVTGCVATATAQIMSFWEYPASINNISINWANLNQYKHKNDFYPSPTDGTVAIAKKKFTRENVASLFQQIGAGVYMLYGCSSSTASTANAISFLVSNGFSSQNLKPFPYNSSVEQNVFYAVLKFSKNPLIARGCDGSVCHAWVIDGLAKKSDSYYIHNNWGWDGNANGYYLSGVFDPSYNFTNVEIARIYR